MGHCLAAVLGMEDLVVPGKDQAASRFTMERGRIHIQLTKKIKFKMFN